MNLAEIAKNYLLLSAELDQLKRQQTEIMKRYRPTQYTSFKPSQEAKRIRDYYSKSIKRIENQCAAIKAAIDAQEPEVRAILTENLIHGQTIEYISYSGYRSISSVNRLKSKGIKALAKYTL